MRLYTVTAEHGSWDSFHTLIIGIFDDESKANDCIKDYEDQMKAIQELKPHKDIDFSDLTDEHMKDQNPWMAKFYYQDEYNKCVVSHFELNRPDFKLPEITNNDQNKKLCPKTGCPGI